MTPADNDIERDEIASPHRKPHGDHQKMTKKPSLAISLIRPESSK
jgi:hypothetical protein